MTERLYYTDSFLQEFEARVLSAAASAAGETVVTLDRSAFYPTSGGQTFDTGWLEVLSSAGSAQRFRVHNVSEDEQTGEVQHVIEGDAFALQTGAVVRGTVDAERRRDHMQQHSGQHVLSAAFEKLYGFATVSFHMGDESCTIDLATGSVSPEQLAVAERLSNEVIAEDRPVEIRFAAPDEARAMGVRKIPAAQRDKLRLIDIRDFDLNACGGTHVRSTGQIGAILLRKTEKVRQGVRVEFVCGLRAVATARRDFETLTHAAGLFSAHIWELPQQIRRSLEEVKAAQKMQHRLLEEVADLQAAQLLGSAPVRAGQKLVVQYFAERDLSFIKMLAQKLTKSGPAIALLACGGEQPALVFAQSPGLGNDMGALMKQTVQRLGTRGGGTRDMAQGGAPDAASAERALREVADSRLN
ncbi:MAG TPA: DHHA1 domain-containing protein [Terriglobales bacterium]|nr:DHHA1 domain-containing protein [Terriglobales bacterium]